MFIQNLPATPQIVRGQQVHERAGQHHHVNVRCLGQGVQHRAVERQAVPRPAQGVIAVVHGGQIEQRAAC